MDYINILTNKDNTQAVLTVSGKVVYEGEMDIASEEMSMMMCLLSNSLHSSTQIHRLDLDTLEGIDLFEVYKEGNEDLQLVATLGAIENVATFVESLGGESEE